MRLPKYILCLISTLVLLFVQLLPAHAQNKVGTTAAPFLNIGVGSRPLGMGGAFVSMADDGHALYWNPAGIARMDRNEVLLIHSTWLVDMSFEYVGMVIAMGQAGSLGMSVTMLDIGEMEVTTVKSQDGTGLFFNSYDLASAIHYGYQFYDKFSVGGTVKLIHQKIWNESADGFAFDIGTLFITPFNDVRLGMNISNFGSKMQMDGRDLLIFHDPDETKQGNNDRVTGKIKTDEWALPMILRLGLSGELIHTQRDRLTLSVDWVVPNDNTEHINLGTEFAFYEMYFLRTGFKALRPGNKNGSFSFIEEDNGGGLTFGAGSTFKLPQGLIVSVNYAFEHFDRLGNVHKYSLSLKY